MSKRTIKRVLHILEEGSNRVRSDPSEENYRKWEKELEKAVEVPKYTYMLIGIGIVVLLCSIVVVLLAGASVIAFNSAEENSLSPSRNSYGPSNQETEVWSYRVPSPAPTATSAACRNSPRRLRLSHKAIVCTYHSNEPVFIREGPSVRFGYIKRLSTGAVVTVLGGPVCDSASGWWYWKVRTLHGYIGWMAEGGDEKDPYFLCPYP